VIWKLLASTGSPVGPRGTLSVLFFHRVLPEPDAMLSDEPTAHSFATLLAWLLSQYTLLPLDEAVQRLGAGSLPAAAAAITFDDGYRDNYSVAAPLLQRMGVPATFFISTGFLDGGIMWNDRVTEAVRRSPLQKLSLPALGLHGLVLGTAAQRGLVAGRVLGALKYLPPTERELAVQQVVTASESPLPTDLMMRSDDVRALADQGFVIGAHTVSHPILASLEDAAAQVEILQCRQTLERLIGRRVGLFAYPNGRAGKDFDVRHRNMAKAAGYDAAFTTEAGAADALADAWALPRFTPWDRTEWRFRIRMLRNQRRRAGSIAACATGPSP
jgi:peptidoglycan/xylan/chitin deacetylase (PgdA/CDA1 family)